MYRQAQTRRQEIHGFFLSYLSYFSEYLALVFLFRCLKGEISLDASLLQVQEKAAQA